MADGTTFLRLLLDQAWIPEMLYQKLEGNNNAGNWILRLQPIWCTKNMQGFNGCHYQSRGDHHYVILALIQSSKLAGGSGYAHIVSRNEE
jgi:hypothetical protein